VEDRIIFKDFKINFQKLLQLGFVKESDFINMKLYIIQAIF